MKIPLLPEVLAPTGDEDVVIHSDGRARRTKLLRIVDSIMGAGAATAARDKAQAWADAAENVAVEPGKYSARHWAAKALAQFNASVGQALAAATSATAALASKNAAGLSEVNSVAAMNTALALVNGLGPNKTYTSYAALVAAFGAAANQSTADVYPDSTHFNRATRYYKDTAVSPGAWIFHRYMDVSPTYYCDSDYGSDLNDGLTENTPLQTLQALMAKVQNVPRVKIRLARGSHWYGVSSSWFSPNSDWSSVSTYGQGDNPIIDGRIAPFTATWVQHATYPNVWYQTVPTALGCAIGPGGLPQSNQWHFGAWDEAPVPLAGNGYGTITTLERAHLRRVMNGDPIPDASYNYEKPQTSTISVASQAALLSIVNTCPGTFTVFDPAHPSSYDAREYGSTAYTYYVHLADGSNPNTNGRTIRINQYLGIMVVSKGMDICDVDFVANGNKDMLGGYMNAWDPTMTLPPDARDIGSGNFIRCRFIEAACHGPVAIGMSGRDCLYVGSVYRGGYKFGGGAYHNYRPIQATHKGRGYRWKNCGAKRFGYAFYAHGGGDGSQHQNYKCEIDGGYFEDGTAIVVGGTTTQGYASRNIRARDIESMGSAQFVEARYENCYMVGRPGVPNYIGSGGHYASNPNCGKVTMVNSCFIGLGTTLYLPNGPLTTLTTDQFITLEMVRSTVWGPIATQTNPQYKQLSLIMRESYLGPFNYRAGALGGEFYLTGTTDIDASSVIECGFTTPDVLRAQHAGIAPGMQTGMVQQLWRHTVTAADMTYVALNAFTATGFVDNGDGTATVTTSFNYGSANMTRAIRIAGANSGAADYNGVVRSIPDTNHIVIAPVPTGAMTGGKACTVGFYRPYPFRDPFTAYIDTDGLHLNVPNGDGFVVGQILRVGNVVAGKPGYGVRKIVALTWSGTNALITLDSPCPWLQPANIIAYRAIATPTTGAGRTLPTVQLSYGFPMLSRFSVDASYSLPKITVTPVEGGPDIVLSQGSLGNGVFNTTSLVLTTYNSAGAAYAYNNADYENGYWAQGLGVAPGDIVTFYSEVDVAEYRMAFATPPDLGGYAPLASCLPAQRKIGYRPSF